MAYKIVGLFPRDAEQYHGESQQEFYSDRLKTSLDEIDEAISTGYRVAFTVNTTRDNQPFTIVYMHKMPDTDIFGRPDASDDRITAMIKRGIFDSLNETGLMP